MEGGARAVDQLTGTRPRVRFTASDGTLGESDQASFCPYLCCSVMASWVERPGSEGNQESHAKNQGLVPSLFVAMATKLGQGRRRLSDITAWTRPATWLLI